MHPVVCSNRIDTETQLLVFNEVFFNLEFSMYILAGAIAPSPQPLLRFKDSKHNYELSYTTRLLLGTDRVHFLIAHMQSLATLCMHAYIAGHR